MNRPFVYPEHPEFIKCENFVQGELLRFARDSDEGEWSAGERFSEANERAKDIVLEVTSKPASRWPSKDFTIGYVLGAGAVALATWLALTI